MSKKNVMCLLAILAVFITFACNKSDSIIIENEKINDVEKTQIVQVTDNLDITGDDLNSGTQSSYQADSLVEEIDKKIENYLELSRKEIEEKTSKYGFISDSNEISNDSTVTFVFDNNDRLSNIFILDVNNVDGWSFLGIDCECSREEAEEIFNAIGTTTSTHNMQATASGIGLEAMGISRVNYGNSDKIGYLDIYVDSKHSEKYKNIKFEIEKNNKANIEYPRFLSSYDKFEELNAFIEDRIDKEVANYSGEETIIYRIECLESDNISISFYKSSREHYESVFAINYNLNEEKEIRYPLIELDETQDKIASWFVNPIQYTLIIYDDAEHCNSSKTIWRE